MRPGSRQGITSIFKLFQLIRWISSPGLTGSTTKERTTHMEIPTFSNFYRTWHAQMTPQWRRLHQQGVADVFNAHLLPRLGELRLDQLNRDRILSLRAELARCPGSKSRLLSASRINKILGLLSQLMDEATLRYPITNPCRNLKRLRVNPPEIQPFSLEQVKLITTEIREDFRDYILTRFFTGIRTGEIDGLEWKNVDFGLNIIRVRAIFSAGEHEEGGKTASAYRDIPMLPLVRKTLLARYERRDPRISWVFHSPRGNPIDAHNFANRVWYPLLVRLNLDKRRPYQTRHTAATLLLSAGESPEWIARVLGHANTEMLFKVYSAYVPNATRKDGAAIERTIGDSFETCSKPEA